MHRADYIRGARVSFAGIVIGKSGERNVTFLSGVSGNVFNITFLTNEGGLMMLRPAAFWGSQPIERAKGLELGKAFKFTAQEKDDGSLTRIRNIQLLSEAELEEFGLPKSIEELKTAIPITSYDQLVNKQAETVAVHGWVGDFRESNGIRIAIEFADETSPPMIGWCSSKFRNLPQELKEQLDELDFGDEVILIGTVLIREGEPQLRVDGIWKI